MGRPDSRPGQALSQDVESLPGRGASRPGPPLPDLVTVGLRTETGPLRSGPKTEFPGHLLGRAPAKSKNYWTFDSLVDCCLVIAINAMIIYVIIASLELLAILLK